MRYDCFFFVKLLKLVKKLAPNTIHSALWAANWWGRIVARLLHIPIFCAHHTVCEHEGKLRMFFDQLLPIKPTGHIAVSNSVACSLEQHLKISKPLITVIPNGIKAVKKPHTKLIPNPHISACPAKLYAKPGSARRNPLGYNRVYQPVRHSPGRAKTEEIPEPKAFTFGAVGRLVPVKNFDVLIESFAQLHAQHPQTQLIILGSGPLESQLRRLIAQKQLSKHVKLITGKNARDYYHHFDCFVQPSAYEGLSLALLEALSAKLPVIVTGVNGRHEIIKNLQNGLLIEPNNTQKLLYTLQVILSNKDLRGELSEKGFQSFKNHYSIELVTQNYQKFLKKP